MTTQHTPTPWKANIESAEGTTVELSDGRKFYISSEGQETDVVHANAAFIVRAVNSHDDLIAALKDCMDNYVTVVANCTDTDATNCDVYKSWEMVLARARGGVKHE